MNFHSSEGGDVDLESGIRLLERVLLRSRFLPRRPAGSWPHEIKILSYDFCILTSCIFDGRVGISHQVSLSKKTPTRKAEMLLYWTDYSAALNTFWELQGLQREGSSLHHRQGRKRAREENSAHVLLLPLGLPSLLSLLSLLPRLRVCLHGIWINSGKNFCLSDTIICLIQAKAWLSTMLVHPSSDWYKMDVLFCYLGAFFFSRHISIIKVTFKRKVGYRWSMHWILFAHGYIIRMLEGRSVCNCPLNFHFICYCRVTFIACFLDWTLCIFAFTPSKQRMWSWDLS